VHLLFSLHLRLGENKLHSPRVVHSSLFSSSQLPTKHRAQAKPVLASNPPTLSSDSPKSLGTAEEA